MRKVKFTQSARKRRIGKAHVIVALNNAGDPTRFPASGDLDQRLLWVGPDDRGVMLEIIGIDLPEYLLIIHVMPLAYRRK